MRYSDPSTTSENFLENMMLIRQHNHFADCAAPNTSLSYDHQKVIDFLSKDSDALQSISKSVMPNEQQL